MSSLKRLRSGSPEGLIDALEREVRHQKRKLAKQRKPQKRHRILEFLTEHEKNYPMFDRICSYLGIGEIIMLTRTCRILSHLFQILLKSQWNMDRALYRFVNSPQKFRSQLGQHDALIGGSFAVQFFDRVTWSDSDLDVFVQSTNLSQLDSSLTPSPIGQYLCESEGYKIECATSHGLTRKSEVYTRLNRLSGLKDTIHLWISNVTPLCNILRTSFTTAQVNFISWNKAYSVFPLPTYIRHKAYILNTSDPLCWKNMLKYTKRGWRTHDTLWEEDESASHSIRSSRSIGDSSTWMIPLDVTEVKRSTTPDFVLETSYFGMVKKRQELRFPTYKIEAEVFTAYTLRHQYVYSYRYSEDFCDGFVRERTDRLSDIEMMKLDGNFSDVLRAVNTPTYAWISHKFPDWTFYDDEIPNWHKTWQKSEEELDAELGEPWRITDLE